MWDFRDMLRFRVMETQREKYMKHEVPSEYVYKSK